MAEVGRPSNFTEGLALDICVGLAVGRSLRSVLLDEGMPSMTTVLRWLRDNTEFRTQYTRAKQEGADALADDIYDMAEEVRRGELDPNAGRVAIDAKKWIASKVKPKVYGDRVDLTTNGKDLPTPIYGGLSQTPASVPPKATQA